MLAFLVLRVALCYEVAVEEQTLSILQCLEDGIQVLGMTVQIPNEDFVVDARNRHRWLRHAEDVFFLEVSILLRLVAKYLELSVLQLGVCHQQELWLRRLGVCLAMQAQVELQWQERGIHHQEWQGRLEVQQLRARALNCLVVDQRRYVVAKLHEELARIRTRDLKEVVADAS
jgi:hypothetical protein